MQGPEASHANNSTRFLSWLSVLVILVFASILALTQNRNSSVVIESAQGPTKTPDVTPTGFVHPIWTAQHAITRSLEAFPDGFTPAGTHAVLITRSTLDIVWLGDSSVQGDPTAAIWLVGVQANGITANDVLGYSDREPFGTGTPLPQIPAEGAFYAWDAGSGDIVVEGALVAGSQYSYLNLIAVQGETPSIITATPPLPLEDLIATNQSHLTATAEASD